MKIVIAPDSFKESMTALEAAQSIEYGFKKIIPEAEYIKIPMADGGEGTVQSLVDATEGEIIYRTVTGPDNKPITAFFGISGDKKTAIIEMASASGLHLIKKNKRNPLTTTSKGTGELITESLNLGINHLIIGLGGSATNDGGAGMAQALGARLLDESKNEIGPGGECLSKLHSIDITKLDSRLHNIKIEVACDVDNPLTGERGASSVFAPQKGATPEMVTQLDNNLSHFAQVLRKDLNKNVDKVKGTGAAGGMGAGLLAFTNAKLKKGFNIVENAVKLEETIQQSSLVITGEGKLDNQIIFGKTPNGVAFIAKKHQIPVIGIAGKINRNQQIIYNTGIDALFSISTGPMSLKQSFADAKDNTESLSENIARLIKIKNNLL